MYKENPDQEFVNMYLNLVTTNSADKCQKFKMVEELYNHVIRGINLGDDYRILIRSRNVKSGENFQ